MTAFTSAASTGPGLERELLARLGLTARANALEIQTAHDDLVEYLERAPSDLRAWARREIESVDEAYALLSDPTADLAAIAASRAPATAAATPATAKPFTAGMAPVADDDYVEELDPDAGRTRRARRAPATAGSSSLSPAQPAASRNGLITRLAIVGVAIVGIAAVVVVGFNFGGGGGGVPGIDGTPAPESSVGAQADPAQVAALMKKISENPNDVATLQQLGDLYFQTGDYETAGGWMEKILAVEPANVTARLALGAALFNSGKATEAETQWRQVLAVDPKNVEAHYDLGFMYLAQEPPDTAKVRAEWNEVIAIAPDSDIAKTVATHLQSLDASPSPGASAGASPAASGPPAPSGSAAPIASASPSAAASPAASAAPSAAASPAAATPAAATPTPVGSPAP